MDAQDMINIEFPEAIDYDNSDAALGELVHALERGETGELVEWIADHALTIEQARAGIKAFDRWQDVRYE